MEAKTPSGSAGFRPSGSSAPAHQKFNLPPELMAAGQLWKPPPLPVDRSPKSSLRDVLPCPEVLRPDFKGPYPDLTPPGGSSEQCSSKPRGVDEGKAAPGAPTGDFSGCPAEDALSPGKRCDRVPNQLERADGKAGGSSARASSLS